MKFNKNTFKNAFRNKKILGGFVAAILIGSAITIYYTKYISSPDCPPVNEELINDKEDRKTVYAASYDMELYLDTDNKKLTGNVQVVIKNETDESLNKICIKNYGAYILKSSEDSVITNCSMDNKTLTITTNNNNPAIIYVEDESTILAAKSTVTLDMSFETAIPDDNLRFGYGEFDGHTMYQLSLCYPTISIYENGKWNEDTYIDTYIVANYNKVADYNVKITCPNGENVVATGTETKDGNVTTIQGDDIRELAIVVYDDMKVISKEINGIEVNCYALDYPNNDEYYNVSLSAAVDSLKLYSSIIGDYPYKELDIVHSFMGKDNAAQHAMEYPGMLVFEKPDVKSYRNLPKGPNPSLCTQVSHGVAHQWFSVAVGNDSYNESWLDEGIAEYFEYMKYRQSNTPSARKSFKYASDNSNVWGFKNEKELHNWLEIMIEQTPRKKPVNSKVTEVNSDSVEYLETVHNGGKLFLYELENAMGQAKLADAIRKYYELYKFEEATTEDFCRIIRGYNNSDEVNDIIDKYINSEDFKR